MGQSMVVILAGLIVCGSAGAQQKQAQPDSLAKLELSVEIATTDDDGYPSALRITITNVGGVPVDMPVLQRGCSPENGIRIESSWTADDPRAPGRGFGGGCGAGDGPSLAYRIQHQWVRLRPGESMTDTERASWEAYAGLGSGTVEYWIEYTPPTVTIGEIASMQRAGYVIPTEKLETQHSSFHVP